MHRPTLLYLLIKSAADTSYRQLRANELARGGMNATQANQVAEENAGRMADFNRAATLAAKKVKLVDTPSGKITDDMRNKVDPETGVKINAATGKPFGWKPGNPDGPKGAPEMLRPGYSAKAKAGPSLEEGYARDRKNVANKAKEEVAAKERMATLKPGELGLSDADRAQDSAKARQAIADKGFIQLPPGAPGTEPLPAQLAGEPATPNPEAVVQMLNREVSAPPAAPVEAPPVAAATVVTPPVAPAPVAPPVEAAPPVAPPAAAPPAADSTVARVLNGPAPAAASAGAPSELDTWKNTAGSVWNTPTPVAANATPPSNLGQRPGGASTIGTPQSAAAPQQMAAAPKAPAAPPPKAPAAQQYNFGLNKKSPTTALA